MPRRSRPEGSPTSLIADGNPSKSVRRFPLGSTIEMRPVCSAPVPVSETNKLLSCLRVAKAQPWAGISERFQHFSTDQIIKNNDRQECLSHCYFPVKRIKPVASRTSRSDPRNTGTDQVGAFASV